MLEIGTIDNDYGILYEYDKNDARFTSKIQYVNNQLSDMGLLSICLLLGINHDVPDLKLHIFENLRKDTLLKDLVDDCENDEEEVITEEDEDDNEVEEVNQGAEITNNYTVYGDARSIASRSGSFDQELNPGHNRPNFSINFRDIVDSIRPFSGSGAIPIETWVQEFNEMAQLMGLNEFQKMIVGKKVLKGNAKLFIMSERGVNTWLKFMHY